jgi:hypothetical protein
MFTLYLRLNGVSHYWTTCGWSDRVRNARRYTNAEARLVATRMKLDGLAPLIARM